MPEVIEPETIKTLCGTFKVDQKTAQHYGNFYHDIILPRIQEKYLAHLTISIEEMINEKLQEKSKALEKNEEKKETSEDLGRKFSIVLLSEEKLPKGLKLPPGVGNAMTISFPKCALICYKQEKDKKTLRISIAHELGHVLLHYKLMLGTEEIENHANTFAYFAISGKNKFYHNKVENMKYTSEADIIDNIQKVCPIREVMQVDHGHLREDKPV